MTVDRRDMLLYAVTDRSWLGKQTLYSQVEQALKGGATFIQLREKNLNEAVFFSEALELKQLCKKYNVPFVINDNVELAKKVNADGVHVGQSDMGAKEVRKLLGADKIIGVSAGTVKEALLAQTEGADYLGVGAVFHTGTKSDADAVSHDTLKAICAAVTIPVVAIGGITKENVEELKESGIAGIAVVSAIFACENIEKATEELKQAVKRVIK